MVRDRVGGQPGIDRRPRAQEPAQQRVHIPFRARALHRSAGARRLVDHGVLGVAPRLERVERAPQQRLDQRIGSAGAARQRSDDGLRTAIPAQGAVAKVGQRTALGGSRFRSVLGSALQFGGQAAAGRNARNQRGRRSQRLSERCQGRRRFESGNPRRKSAAPRRVAARALQFRHHQRILAAGDLHAARAGFQHRPGRARTVRAVRAPDLDRFGAQLRARARGRAQRADLALDLHARPRPVDLGILLADLARIAGTRFRLRHGVARVRRRYRQAQARWRARQARRACRAGTSRRRPRRWQPGACASTGPVSSPASICMIVIAGFAIAREQRPLDRRRAAPARQQRRVDVERATAARRRARAAAGSVRRRRPPEPPVALPRCARARRRHSGLAAGRPRARGSRASCLTALADGRRPRPAGRSGCVSTSANVMTCSEQRRQRVRREFGRTGED